MTSLLEYTIEGIKDTFVEVTFNKRELTSISKLADRIEDIKRNDPRYKTDNHQVSSRWTTGIMAEMAVCKLMGEKFDVEGFEIGIQSKKYDVPDLEKYGYKVGVKGSDLNKNNFPMVGKHPTYPEIMVLIQGDKAYVCGLAEVSDLINFTDSVLIRSPKAAFFKTGFYGFHNLVALSSDKIKFLDILQRFKI